MWSSISRYFLLLLEFYHFVGAELNSNSLRNNHILRKLHRVGSTEAPSCKTYPYVTRRQRHLCRRYPDVMQVALEGLEMAVKECRYQFRDQRWNCADLVKRHGSPFVSSMFNKGYKETSFIHAMLSSAIVHSVARACASGTLISCGCDRRQKANGHNYHIAGCNHNVKFASKFARKFLDGRQRARDLLSFIHAHNSKLGRVLIRRSVETKCKCHGLSGSCEFKTCWRAVPTEFRVIGDLLKKRYDDAVRVQVMNDANGLLTSSSSSGERRNKPDDLDLVFSERSPNFCEPLSDLDYAGVTGRNCRREGPGSPGSCSSLCCGHGYSTEEVVVTKRCNCVFKWCCQVICQKCEQVKTIHKCK